MLAGGSSLAIGGFKPQGRQSDAEPPRSILNRDLSMFMPRVISSRISDNDVFVRWDRQPNVDSKSHAMTMLVAWSDNGYAASRNALIMCL